MSKMRFAAREGDEGGAEAVGFGISTGGGIDVLAVFSYHGLQM